MKYSPFDLCDSFNEIIINNAIENLIDILNPEINFNF